MTRITGTSKHVIEVSNIVLTASFLLMFLFTGICFFVLPQYFFIMLGLLIWVAGGWILLPPNEDYETGIGILLVVVGVVIFIGAIITKFF